MTTVTNWTPFREMEDLQNRLSSIFGRSAARHGGEEAGGTERVCWAPSVDITEDSKEFVIKAELPELRREEVSVTVEGGVLRLAGERKIEKEENGKKYHRVERQYGHFERSFKLPEEVDCEKVTAEFGEGILKVHLVKSGRTLKRNIAVTVA